MRVLSCGVAVWSVLVTVAVAAVPGSAMAWSNIGPPGGAVQGVAVAGDGGRFVYLAVGSTFWVSQDGGASFHEPVRKAMATVPFAVDPADPRHLWRLVPGAVMVSKDAGAHWSTLASFQDRWASYGWLAPDPWVSGAVDVTVPDENNRRPLVRLLEDGGRQVLFETDCAGPVAAGGNTLYVFTCHGILRSSDGGHDWSPVVSPDVGILACLAPNPAAGEQVLAGGSEGIALSLDGGRSWQESAFRDRVVSMAWGAGVAWAITDRQLWISRNGGLQWSRAALHGGWLKSVVADPSDPATVYVASRSACDGFERPGLLRSKDFGRRFEMADTGVVATEIGALSPAPAGTGPGLIVQTRGGELMARNVDGVSWHSLDPHDGWGVTAFCRDPADGRRLLATSLTELGGYYGDAVYVSEDGGSTWARRTDPFPRGEFYELAVDPFSPDRVFAAGKLGLTVFDMADGSMECPFCDGSGVESVVALETFPGVVLGGGEGLWRSVDGGISWQRQPEVTPQGSTCTDLAVSPWNADLVAAACTSEPGTGWEWGLRLSLDGGRHWQRVPGPEGLRSTTVDFDPAVPGRLLVGTANHGVWEGMLWRPRARRVQGRAAPVRPIPAMEHFLR